MGKFSGPDSFFDDIPDLPYFLFQWRVLKNQLQKVQLSAVGKSSTFIKYPRKTRIYQIGLGGYVI